MLTLIDAYREKIKNDISVDPSGIPEYPGEKIEKLLNFNHRRLIKLFFVFFLLSITIGLISSFLPIIIS